MGPRIGPRAGPVVPPRISGHTDRAAIGRDGSRSHGPIPTAVRRERCAEHRGVLRDATAVGSAAGDDDPERDTRQWLAARNPASFDRDLDREPALPVGRAEEFVHIRDVGFELDDQQRPQARVPREDVDDTAFAVDREGHLRRRDPLRQVAERSGNRFVEARVPGVQQPVEVAGSPSPDDVDPDVERGGDGTEAIKRERAEVPALDPRNRCLADPRPKCEFGLAPSPPNPHESDRAAEPLVAHPPSVTSARLPATYLAHKPHACSILSRSSTTHPHPERTSPHHDPDHPHTSPPLSTHEPRPSTPPSTPKPQHLAVRPQNQPLHLVFFP